MPSTQREVGALGALDETGKSPGHFAIQLIGTPTGMVPARRRQGRRAGMAGDEPRHSRGVLASASRPRSIRSGRHLMPARRATAASSTSSPSQQQVLADDQRRQQAQHVAVGAAGEHDDALRRGSAAGHRGGGAGSGSVVPGRTSSTASIAPRPRTSPIAGYRLGQRRAAAAA